MEELNPSFFLVLRNTFFSVSYLLTYLLTYFASTYSVSTLEKVLICGLDALKKIIAKTQCKNYAKHPL